MNDRPLCLTDLLERAAAGHPARGMRYAGERGHVAQPYPALLADAQRVLGGLGVRPGRPVVLCLDRPRDLVTAFWGCVLGGYVPCPLRTAPRRWTEQLDHLTGLLEAPLVIADGELPPVRGQDPVDARTLIAGAPDTSAHRAGPGDLA